MLRRDQLPPPGTDSLTPRFRAAVGQPGHGAAGRLANRVGPPSANRPIASRRRGTFEWQLHASRSAPGNEAPNSNPRSLTPATRARGGARPACAGDARSDWPREKTALQFRVRTLSRPWPAAMASGSGAGAGAAAAASANLNAVRETMDGECPFRPFSALLTFSRGKDSRRGGNSGGLGVQLLPRLASLASLPRDLPGPQG